MSNLKVSFFKKQDTKQIKELMDTYEFNEYRNYRILDKDKLKAHLFNQILNSMKQNRNWVLAAEEKKEIRGITTLHFLSWDTKHFGMRMAKIGYLIARADYNYKQAFAIKNKLVSKLLQLCKRERIIHLSCRIDTNDTSAIHTLEASGFRITDTLSTYLFNKIKYDIPKIKDLYKVRALESRDLEKTIALAKESFRKSRFYKDPYIPKDKASDLYKEWIMSYHQKTDAKIYIAEDRHKDAVGFLAYKFNKELEQATGYRVMERILSAVSPNAKGAYLSLVKQAMKDVVLLYDWAEIDAQVDNYEVIRVYQKFGFRIVSTKHVFHKWLGDIKS